MRRPVVADVDVRALIDLGGSDPVGASYRPYVIAPARSDLVRFTNPLVTWSTDEASPSGAVIVRGNLYVGALQCECVWRVPLHGAKTGKPRKMLTGYGRIRTVVRAPDGALWIATSNRDGRGSPGDGDDRIVRVTLRR